MCPCSRRCPECCLVTRVNAQGGGMLCSTGHRVGKVGAKGVGVQTQGQLQKV